MFIIDKHYQGIFGKKWEKRKVFIFKNKLKFKSDLILKKRGGSSTRSKIVRLKKREAKLHAAVSTFFINFREILNFKISHGIFSPVG